MDNDGFLIALDMLKFGFADLEECAAIASLANMGVYPLGKQKAQDAIAMCIKYGYPID